jgi:hypothetical protein
MELVLRRDDPLFDRSVFPAKGTTFGRLFVDGAQECQTLEDAVLEDEYAHVEDWKIPGRSATPAGRYRIEAQDSPKFGARTLTLLGVPGFDYIRIHSGETIEDTEGCIVVGDQVDLFRHRISGGKLRGVLQKLKDKVLAALDAGEEVWIEIHNATA